MSLRWCSKCCCYPTCVPLNPLFWILWMYVWLDGWIFRERGKEGEREGGKIDVWEKHWFVASCMPPTKDLICSPAPTRNRNMTLVCGMMPNPLSYTSQGIFWILLTVTFQKSYNPFRLLWLTKYIKTFEDSKYSVAYVWLTAVTDVALRTAFTIN